MTDVHNPETRRYNMRQIKGKNTKPEIVVRSFLHAHGFRYRLHVKDLPGKPDIVLPKYRTVLFVNGCFWHGHEGCKYFQLPQTRSEWWKDKINKNRERDVEKTVTLKNLHWNVLTIFECELKSGKKDQTLRQIIEILRTNSYDKRNTQP
jgi:DNA mismatch endonuclease (patch repair protein)